MLKHKVNVYILDMKKRNILILFGINLAFALFNYFLFMGNTTLTQNELSSIEYEINEMDTRLDEIESTLEDLEGEAYHDLPDEIDYLRGRVRQIERVLD